MYLRHALISKSDAGIDNNRTSTFCDMQRHCYRLMSDVHTPIDLCVGMYVILISSSICMTTISLRADIYVCGNLYAGI